MSKTKKRINVSMATEVHDKATKDSLELYGEVNVSRLVCDLIKANKPKK